MTWNQSRNIFIRFASRSEHSNNSSFTNQQRIYRDFAKNSSSRCLSFWLRIWNCLTRLIHKCLGNRFKNCHRWKVYSQKTCSQIRCYKNSNNFFRMTKSVAYISYRITRWKQVKVSTRSLMSYSLATNSQPTYYIFQKMTSATFSKQSMMNS